MHLLFQLVEKNHSESDSNDIVHILIVLEQIIVIILMFYSGPSINIFHVQWVLPCLTSSLRNIESRPIEV